MDDAIKILTAGGIVAHATETCYGFACDLTNPQAVKRLFALKKRPTDQPVSVLFSSVEEAKKFVEWNEEAEKLASKYLPGPLTIILPARKDAPDFYTVLAYHLPLTSYRSMGIRISSHSLARELAKRFGKPLSTTSANLHGQKNTYSVAEISGQFSGQDIQPDMILDSGVLPPTPPSTVIDLTVPGSCLVLRKGLV